MAQSFDHPFCGHYPGCRIRVSGSWLCDPCEEWVKSQGGKAKPPCTACSENQVQPLHCTDDKCNRLTVTGAKCLLCSMKSGDLANEMTKNALYAELQTAYKEWWFLSTFTLETARPGEIPTWVYHRAADERLKAYDRLKAAEAAIKAYKETTPRCAQSL